MRASVGQQVVSVSWAVPVRQVLFISRVLSGWRAIPVPQALSISLAFSIIET